MRAQQKVFFIASKDGGCGGFIVTQLPYREDTREVPPGDIGARGQGHCAERMLETAREEIESFSLSLPEDDVPAKKERKRKEPPAPSKPEFVREGIDEEWIDMYKNDELDALKNDQLKAFLKGQGERVAGRKSEFLYALANNGRRFSWSRGVAKAMTTAQTHNELSRPLVGS